MVNIPIIYIPKKSSFESQVSAYFALDETTGNRISSNNLYNLIPVGSVSFTSGKKNNAVMFNGTNQYLYLNNFLNYNSFTICFWVNFGNVSSWQVLIASINESSKVGWRILINLSFGNRIVFEYFMSGFINVSELRLNNGNIILNQWAFISLVYNSENGAIILSVNQTQSVAVNTIAATIAYSPLFYVGAQLGWSPGFNGAIDEISFYNQALSNEQITAIYNS